MAAVVTAYSCEAMGEVAALKIFFYYFCNNRSPEPILPLEALIVDLYKLLKMIGDTLIEWRLLRIVGAVYSQLFFHNGSQSK